MRPHLFLIIISFFFMFNCFAQEDRLNQHHLGYNIGVFSGLGITYRFLPEKIGFQTSAFFINNQVGHKYYNHSVSFIYKLRERKERDVLWFIGGQGLFSWIQRPSGNNVESFNYANFFDYSIGTGIGLNLFKNKRINSTILLGYAFMNLNSKSKLLNIPTLEIGVFYKLNHQ